MADRQCDHCLQTTEDSLGHCRFCGLPYDPLDRLSIPMREVAVSQPGWDLQRNCEIQGWMSEDELAWLFDTAKSMLTIVEVGCWKGRSTYALLSGCPGTVYAVDHWKGSPDELEGPHLEVKTTDIFSIFQSNVGHFPNLHIMKMDSRTAAEYISSADMVFIDGCHMAEAVLSDLQTWTPKATKLICGHDVHITGVTQAIAQHFGGVKLAVGSIWAYSRPVEELHA